MKNFHPVAAAACLSRLLGPLGFPTTIYLFAVTFLSMLLVLQSCIEEDFTARNFITAQTLDAVVEDVDVIRLSGQLESQETTVSLPLEYGFVLSSTNRMPELNDPDSERIKVGDQLPPAAEEGKFNLVLEDRLISNIYYFRAYVQLGDRVSMGNVVAFSLSENLQIAISDDVEVMNDKAKLTGILILKFQGELRDHGFLWSKDSPQRPAFNPLDSAGLGPTNDDGEFVDTLTDLSLNSTYYAWAYAQVGNEFIYSDSIVFEIKDGWKKTAFLDDRYTWRPVGEVIGNFGYFGLGCFFPCDEDEAKTERSNAFWSFDPTKTTEEEVFVQQARLPDGRRDGVSFVIDEKMYFGLGKISNSYLQDFWMFDPTTSQWQLLAQDSFPGAGRKGAVAFVLDGRAYVGTGISSSFTYYSDFFVFDPALSAGDRWRKLDKGLPIQEDTTFIGTDDNSGRAEAIAFTLNDVGYVGTGVTSGSTELSDIWRFDPGTEEFSLWTQQEFPNRSEAVAFVYDNSAYIALGLDKNGRALQDIWEFDGTTWTQRTPFPSDLEFSPTLSFSMIINDRIYLGGSNFDFISTDFWEYVPKQ